jgi:hypothetical protein
MMKKLYSVYDVKTGVYMDRLMVLLTDGEALRVIADTVNAKGNIIADHPADFRLDFIGEINLVTGEILTLNAPRHVIDCAQLKEEGK